MILVTGATGTTGREVVRELADLGVPVRAMGRDWAQLEKPFDSRVEKVVADFEDSASLCAALIGVKQAFLLSANMPNQREQEACFLRAAKSAGLDHIVRLSAADASPDSAQLILRWHGEMDAAVMASGISWTILRPHWFMQNMFKCAPADQTEIFLPMKRGKIAAIDVRDIGAVSARVLAGAGHGSKTYTLTGPQSQDFTEIASELSAVTGSPKTYVDLPPEQFQSALIAFGQSEWAASAVTDLFAGNVAIGAQAEVTGDVRSILNREPISFHQFFADHRTTFAPD